ncbi:SulP family inorganic anion transporter [Candidatus Saccharibacteria bacterium]|nr:SulP family inorganic anion transporter [Candidatus Saccharibacteria bacterium]
MTKAYTPSVFRYKKKYLKSDIIAALVVTSIAIPESLAFAVIVGLPPVTGLYSALFAPIVFGLLASTRRLVIGADSATAALIASGALLIAQAGTVGYTSAIAILGLLTAAILMFMALFRLGFLADLISRPVLVGFLAGVGVQLIITKLPEMLGLTATGSLWQHLVSVMYNVGSFNGMTLTVSVLVVGVIILTRKTRIPGELLGIVMAGLFAIVFRASEYGVALVGELPSGFPPLSYPVVSLGDVAVLFPAALAIAVVILAQSSAVIRSIAGEHDDKVKLNQDLFALGVANAISALTRGFSVNGSPPRSIAADLAGGRSQMVNILMGLFIGLLLLFGTGVFMYLPSAALAAVVFMIGFRLIRVQEFRVIWKSHRTEFFVAMVALIGTAVFGVQQGVLLAVIISLMERLSRQYRPKDEILLRDGMLSDWAKERVDQHHRHDSHPAGLLVYSFDGSLFFENITYFTTRVRRAIDMAKKPVHYVVVDAGAIDSIDYTAVEVLKQLYRQLSVDGIKLGFAHVSPNLYTQFDEYGVIDLVGSDNIFSTLNAAIKTHPSNKQTAFEMISQLGIKPGTYVVIGGAVLEALNLRDTNDIDMVVDDETFAYYRDKKHWNEFVQDNGKKILTHNGYNIMHTWMGKNFKQLKRSAFERQGVTFMNIEDLIDAKRRLGRKKDMSDIALLHEYQRVNKN